jgi:hypothetical protein
MKWVLLVTLSAVACKTPERDCPASAPTSVPSSPPTPPASPSVAAPIAQPALAPAAATAASERAAKPSPLRAGNQVDSPTGLEEINRWATAAGVRESLLDWVAAGLATENTGTEVDIDYVGVESPVTAVATVTLDGYLDDSVRGQRFVLKFSRKPCDTCASGMSGWWLWEMDVTRRCYKGRGHEDFAKGACL